MSMRWYVCAAGWFLVPALALAAPTAGTNSAAERHTTRSGVEVCQGGGETERQRELEEPDAPQRDLEIGDDQNRQDDLEQGGNRQRDLEAPDDRQQGLDTPGAVDDDNDDD